MGLIQMFLMHKAQMQNQAQQQQPGSQFNQQDMMGLINQMMQANQQNYSKAAGGYSTQGPTTATPLRTNDFYGSPMWGS
jgi:hypothetical protein